ncbi:HAD family hydrolase [Vagococcus sp. PNs007]|uniref:HAD family hydrolase n=1 Tax=Vagococcus proximus TaxID=2991417 RepID=A0ABT5X456_9ENTE|nr:HAD family hydrolase [Vagococcus proximus]MDF0480782.1 HAD family hydrolase [Vagococcus proximus]
MKKAIFIDIDGTLVDLSSEVPESASNAIKEARKNGHQVFICTGRSNPEILPEIRAVGFDGIIGAGGAYIEYQNEVIFHKTLPKEEVLRLIDLFEQEKIGCYFETNDGLYSNRYCVPTMERNVTKGLPDIPEIKAKALKQMSWFTDLLKDVSKYELDYSKINKICFLNDTYPYEKIEEDFGQDFELHRITIAQYGENSGEAGVKGCDKKAAVERMLKIIGLPKSSAVAFGDGDNDIAMFEAVALKIAMENGTDALKALADDITATPENDGLAKAFKKHHLI